MKFINNRAAAFGAAGALVAGSLVSGGMLAPANAATAQYTCQLSTGPTPLAITGTMALPTGLVDPGASLAGLPTTLGVTLPATLTGALIGLGIPGIDGGVPTASFPIQGTGSAIPAGPLDLPAPVVFSSGQPANLFGEGVTGAATAPTERGRYNVLMPSSFEFVPTGAPLPAIPCTTTAPAKVGTLTVSEEKLASTTTVKLKNAPITTAKRAKLAVTVKDEFGGFASGKVLAKEGTRILVKATSLNDGKKVLRLPKLKRGKHTVKVVYKGNATTKASSKSITFRVRRA